MLSFLRISFFMFFASGLFLTGCKNEDDVTVDPNIALNTQLEGEWDVKSFTEDGVEYMESLVNSFELEFEKEGPMGGELESTIIYSDGTTERNTVNYEIKNNGREIEIDDSEEYELEIDGDELTMEGIVDGYRVVIKADLD